MSDSDSHDDDTTDRTRVRRRMVRGAASMPVEVTEPVGQAAADPPAARGRSRRRPAVANPFAIEPTPVPPADATDADAGQDAQAVAEGLGAEGDDAWPAQDDSAEDGPVEDGSVGDGPVEDDSVEDGSVDDDGWIRDDVAGRDHPAARDRAAGAPSGGPDQQEDVVGADDVTAREASDDAASADVEEEQAGRRRRRRGGRGRRGRGGAGDAPDVLAVHDQPADDQPADDQPADEQPADEQPAEEEVAAETADAIDPGRLSEDAADVAVTADGEEDDAEDDGRPGSRRRRRGRRGRGRRPGTPGSVEEDDAPADRPAGSTRLSARSQRPAGARRRIPTVSPETRRVMAESPPKKMLVTLGTERTQIAVLEERTLVEHYVTQASEASYVGNIYKGRVQNVLPGMEAAFVDIGKGRNGVLYAGEVNYDEADRDGGLPRIEQALKPGQTVMVQVTKDPMGTKGARLTQHLSLAGRYCVLAPGDDMLGISRKLPDDQRERLRKILKTLKPEGFGLIVRTAAETATPEQLEADVKRLIERWQKVEEKAAAAKVLEPVYAEPSLVLRVIRDVFGPEHTRLVIDDAELAGQVKEYLEEVSPEHVDKVEVHEGRSADGVGARLFDAYEVTVQIRRALEKKVWLKSGGYLIIEKTEAMWVIDVNTGKFVGKDNLEETVLRNNIEAAEEIARQLRLRDMGGIIVIDFVDMIVPANRDEVLKRFKRELARDKTKSRVMEISKLGLVQMTRKNVSKGLMESFTEETDDVIPGRRIVEDLLA